MMSTNHLTPLQLQQLHKIPTMGVGTLMRKLNYCSSNLCESVINCSTFRFNSSRSTAGASRFLWYTIFLRIIIGKSPTDLHPKNAIETQSDLLVLSSELGVCHQDRHVGLHLGGNVVVHHPVGSKIPHFHRVYKRQVRRMCATCSGTLGLLLVLLIPVSLAHCFIDFWGECSKR